MLSLIPFYYHIITRYYHLSIWCYYFSNILLSHSNHYLIIWYHHSIISLYHSNQSVILYYHFNNLLLSILKAMLQKMHVKKVLDDIKQCCCHNNKLKWVVLILDLRSLYVSMFISPILIRYNIINVFELSVPEM